MTQLSGQLDSGSHGREAERFEALRLKQRERSRCRLLFANRFKATRGVGCVRASSLSGNRIQICARGMAELAGFKPATSCLEGDCSIQMSYSSKKWLPLEDSDFL